MEKLSIVINVLYENQSLLDYLTKRYTYQSELEWSVRILKNEILVNSEFVEPSYLLKKDDIVQFDLSLIPEPNVNTNYSVLYEDEYLIAIDKPGDLPVHPTGRYRNNTLTSILKKDLNLEPYIINRLDRETSGIVLLAKSKAIAGQLGKLFSNRKVNKTYIVYVYGVFPNLPIVLSGLLISDDKSKIRKKKSVLLNTVNESQSNFVYTEFTKLEDRKGISKLLAKPKTGKIHQIRASLYSYQYPILGDKIYGINEEIFLDFIQRGSEIYKDPKYSLAFKEINRQALHAHLLEFEHPVHNRTIRICSEEPEDMKKIHLCT